MALTNVVAQEKTADAAVSRGPRFYYAPDASKTPSRVDVTRTPTLMRRIALDLRGVTVEEALEAITSRAGLKLSYSKALLPADKRVRLSANEISVAGAISEVLMDVNVDVLFTASGQAALVPRREMTE